MEKITYSINHSPSLSDAPGTEACALELFFTPLVVQIQGLKQMLKAIKLEWLVTGNKALAKKHPDEVQYGNREVPK